MNYPYRSYVVGSICTCAAMMASSAFLYKTTRTNGTDTWHDSVGFWTVASMVCGIAVILLMFTAVRIERYALPAVTATFLFALSAALTTFHRMVLENDFEEQRTFTNQALAASLHVVPWTAMAGLICSAVLIVIEFNDWAMKQQNWPTHGPPAVGAP